jgi:FPC/CPF motif-containing protein YcgG
MKLSEKTKTQLKKLAPIASAAVVGGVGVAICFVLKEREWKNYFMTDDDWQWLLKDPTNLLRQDARRVTITRVNP